MQKVIVATCLVALFLLSPARGQDNPNNTQPVTREEFEQLKKDNAEMKKELAALKKGQTQQAANAEQDAQDYDTQLKIVRDLADRARRAWKASFSPATPTSAS